MSVQQGPFSKILGNGHRGGHGCDSSTLIHGVPKHLFGGGWRQATALLALTPLLLPTEADACGISTHQEVSHRAAYWFDAHTHPDYASMVAEHPEALMGGASFPDWGYATPNFGDAAEEAHWDPFLKFAADYVYRNYPPPWNRETEMLAVFLFAVSAHSVADMSWHGLGVDEGFIDVLSDQDFGGDWDAAHTAADTGGDMVAAYELDQSWFLPSWYVPVQDVLEIYHEMGYTSVNRTSLLLANWLLYIGGQAERLAGHLLYKPFARSSPLLTDLYQDYFAGGVDDMGTFSAWKWEEMIDWMENGVASERFNPIPDTDHLALHEPAIRQGLAMIRAGELVVRVEQTPRGVIFHASAPNLEMPERRHFSAGKAPESKSLRRALPRSGSRTQASPVASFVSQGTYAHLGTSLTSGDFDHDGKADLVMGAPAYGSAGSPQVGALVVWSGKSTGLSGTLSVPGSGLLIEGDAEYGRLGFALATLDFNADGITDLAASTPTLGARSFDYTGGVQIYFGHAGSGLSTSPDVVIGTSETYANLGHFLGSGDVDGDGHADLLIGAPYAREGGMQRGLAAVFLSSVAHRTGQRLDVLEADWRVSGSEDNAWFGAHMAVASLQDGSRQLLIGAPTANPGGVPSAGTLFAYDVTTLDAASMNAPYFILNGTVAFAQLGLRFAVGDPYGTGYPVVALGSPTFAQGSAIQAGEVRLLPLHELFGPLSIEEARATVTLRGSEDYARFGWSLLLIDQDLDGRDDLTCCAPNRKTSAGVEAGACFAWSGAALPTGTVARADEQAPIVLEGQEAAARFGHTLTALDLSSATGLEWVVGAKQSSQGGTLAGAVLIQGR